MGNLGTLKTHYLLVFGSRIHLDLVMQIGGHARIRHIAFNQHRVGRLEESAVSGT